MLKSRWLWIGISGLAILLIAPPVAYRLCWYPHTLRGRFERVQLGMAKSEVTKILGKPGTFYTQWPSPMVFGEEWRFEKGEIKYQKSKGGLTYPIQIEDKTGRIQLPPTWGYDEAQIMVQFDDENQVSYKSWVQFSNLSPFWERVRRWLPLR